MNDFSFNILMHWILYLFRSENYWLKIFINKMWLLKHEQILFHLIAKQNKNAIIQL